MFGLSLLTLLVGNQAIATTYGTIYTVQEMTDLAHDVVSGTVTKLESRHEDGIIKTNVTLNIEHNFVGNKKRQFTFEVVGGTVDGITLDVPGSPTFTEGDKVLLFLDHQQVVGFGQGAYAIGPERIAKRSFEGVSVMDAAASPNNTLDLAIDLPDETEARSCLEVKVWDDYNDDWTLRSVEVDHLASGEFKSYPLTLLSGMEYEFVSCTDQKADFLQLTLYNSEGESLETVYETGREATMLYKSDRNQTVILSVQVDMENPDVRQVGTSVGVLYR